MYHITHVENLASIIADGGLDCDTACVAAGRTPISIAYTDLKAKRALKVVEVAGGGTLADYVPFYFAPRSPMLYAIAHGYVEAYQGDQASIVHLVSSVEVLASTPGFVVTDGHPISPLSSQFDSADVLDTLDWGIMAEQYWADTDQDGDRKRRRQAEFLVPRRVPFEAVCLVGAMTQATATRASALLHGVAARPPVSIRPDWYY